jgi:hypothetical protein
MIILYLIFKNQLNNLYQSEAHVYGSSALKMFGRNQSIAKSISSGGRRAAHGFADRAMMNVANGGSSIKTNLYEQGMRASRYVARNPRRAAGGAVGGVGLGIGALGLAGNGGGNNSPYQDGSGA